jgi:BolA-like protein 3
MLSTLVRRVAPSLPRSRPYAAAAYTQAAASSASKLNEGEQAIYDKLSKRFQPSELIVQDVSGAPFQLPHSPKLVFHHLRLGGCGTFYAITIVSAAFKGIPLVRQHRLVNEVLEKEIKGFHGLQVCTDHGYSTLIHICTMMLCFAQLKTIPQ